MECSKVGTNQVFKGPGPGLAGRLGRVSLRRAVQGGGEERVSQVNKVGGCFRHQNVQGLEVTGSYM